MVSLSNSTSSGTLSLNAVKDSMMSEELRRKEHGEEHSQALVNDWKGQSKGRTETSHAEGSPGRSFSWGRSKSGQSGPGRLGKHITCFNCGKKGHKRWQCKEQPRREEALEVGESKSTAVAICADVNAGDVGLANISWDDSTWIVDSGASFHITPRKDLFISYTPGEFGVVRMGNDQSCPIVGRRTVVMEMPNKTTW